MAKSRPYLVPITFCSILAFFGWKKGCGQGLKSPNENLTYPIAVSQFWGILQSKKFGLSTCQFCCYRSQGSCFLNFKPLFRVWLLFQVPHPIIWKKYLSFSNVVFNSASIDTNFKRIRQISKEILYYFLLAPSRFSADLIKFTFSVFPDPSGRMGKFFPDPGDREKLAGTFTKKSSPYLHKNSF